MRVILISGKAQHGKDTAAGIIRETLEAEGYRVLITHYADLVKYVCKAFFGWDGQKDERGRSLLQYVGTDVVRSANPNYWVKFVADMLEFFHDDWDYVLIPDTRFPNEVDYIKHTTDIPCIHIRVIRPDFESSLTPEQKAHPSETALDTYQPDLYLLNRGTEEELRDVIRHTDFNSFF